MKARQRSHSNYDLFGAVPMPAEMPEVMPETNHNPPFPAAEISELPDLNNLYRMFDIYNRQYFENKLPRVKILYSKRLMAAGCYYPTKKEIRISEKYHALFPDEVYDTLKHEMIHLIHFRHNAAFKKIARRIGASLKANEHPSLRKPPRYLYVCPQCQTEYPRQKRIRMGSCGRCSPGKFDKRCKLILSKKLIKVSGS